MHSRFVFSESSRSRRQFISFHPVKFKHAFRMVMMQKPSSERRAPRGFLFYLLSFSLLPTSFYRLIEASQNRKKSFLFLSHSSRSHCSLLQEVQSFIYRPSSLLRVPSDYSIMQHERQSLF